MDITQISIDSLNLSARLRNVLKRADIHTVGQLLQWSDEDLIKLHNMGAKSMQELQDCRAALLSPEAPMEFPECKKIQDFSEWLHTNDGRAFVSRKLQEKQLGIDAIALLPPRTYNLLRLADWNDLEQLLFATEDELLQVSHLTAEEAAQTVRLCQDQLESYSAWLHAAWEQEQLQNLQQEQKNAIHQTRWYLDTDIREPLQQFLLANDRRTEEMLFPIRVQNRLLRDRKNFLSQFAFRTEDEWMLTKGVSSDSVKQTVACIDRYFMENQERIERFLSGDKTVLWLDEEIKKRILELYRETPFSGLSFQDFRSRLSEFSLMEDSQLKRVIGRLLAEGKLEYVDYRCYRIYPSVNQVLEQSKSMDPRHREILQYRFQELTLEEIAQKYNLTRERVRQITVKAVRSMAQCNLIENNLDYVDEDYYRYFYQTYAFEKQDAIDWLGIPESVFHYFETAGVKRGTRDLSLALEDPKHLDFGLRLKIKQYLHRNQILVDGRWVDKKRPELESIVIRKYCQADTNYNDFGTIYNAFLQEHGIPEGDKLYYTPEVTRSRRNHLEQSHDLLWKLGGIFRAYDINGRDYTELWETLQLESYENVEYSAQKFVNDYPELMRRYDIQDGYELHNLMRKALPENSIPGFRFGKQPVLCFGEGNRTEAIFDLIVENAPIHYLDLAQLVYQEYGFAPDTIAWTIPSQFSAYFHKGMLTVDQKKLSDADLQKFSDALTEPFYYFGEIKKIYRALFPDGDLEMINPYNLKRMGFLIRSRYVIRGYPSAEAYFTEILTKEDIFDCKPYRNRYNLNGTFSSVLTSMRRELDLIEFGPDQYITCRRLQAAGVTKERLRQFCDEVDDYVESGSYFSISSIRADGFVSDLFELGMEDWFYANLLFADKRFAYGMMFGCPVLYKGNLNITIKSFLYDQLQTAGSYDVLEWIHILETRHGCRNIERNDIWYKLEGTDAYYDSYLDRIYANAELYYQELDQMEDA